MAETIMKYSDSEIIELRKIHKSISKVSSIASCPSSTVKKDLIKHPLTGVISDLLLNKTF